ncbi:hypothetical protein [Mariniblastus fucicola]|uniref:Response regulatory domain-containing protein n=1 Tax=Mariniblastus fucicola TaxID=980251 RepID=A0A5B9PBI6_9BACT|nr:hypothetical protein [Mariniblastus fucicola]QEG22809.1 hypothetical protein MFFC18_26930 [Mariniblastus fucicola]
MSTLQILISGDYWHGDFREPFSKLEIPATMVPLERIKSVEGQAFNLIVLAQSRRDQMSQTAIDSLRTQFPEVPIVVLLGSWCEGENRSGTPLIGVSQTMWHQWESRFERFCVQVSDGVRSDWHQPLTASVSDRVRDFSPDGAIVEKLIGKMVVVSSEDRTTAETISEMLKTYQCDSLWAEAETDLIDSADVDAICIDANGVSSELKNRISNFKDRFEDTPVVVAMNFPRQQDMNLLSQLGVQEIVSKPYTHNEFLQSLLRALDASTGFAVPKPSILSRNRMSRR